MADVVQPQGEMSILESEEGVADSSAIQERIQRQSDRQSHHICQQVIGRPISEADERLCTLCTYGQEQSKYHSKEDARSQYPEPEEAGSKGANKASDSEKTKMSNLIPVFESQVAGYPLLADRGKQQYPEDQHPYDKDGKFPFHIW